MKVKQTIKPIPTDGQTVRPQHVPQFINPEVRHVTANILDDGKNVTLAFLASTIGPEALVISLLAVAKGIAKVFRHGFTSPFFLSLNNPANSISS